MEPQRNLERQYSDPIKTYFGTVICPAYEDKGTDPT